ncbi:MAG: hypothetical protein NZ891_05370 [bacterium]|nr:hypothetical protein [bacterium]MDW8164152.1 hypothetical protein [Candidatus Omnitrophota bacterium]
MKIKKIFNINLLLYLLFMLLGFNICMLLFKNKIFSPKIIKDPLIIYSDYRVLPLQENGILGVIDKKELKEIFSLDNSPFKFFK